MNAHQSSLGKAEARRKFREDLKFLCLGQNVDDVFVGAVAMLLSSIQQRTESKEEALAMLGVASAAMMRAMELDYETLVGELDGAQFRQ